MKSLYLILLILIISCSTPFTVTSESTDGGVYGFYSDFFIDDAGINNDSNNFKNEASAADSKTEEQFKDVFLPEDLIEDAKIDSGTIDAVEKDANNIVTCELGIPCQLTSCSEIKNHDYFAQSGTYKITIVSDIVPVYCDMDYLGGGWTLFYSARADKSCVTEGYVTEYSSKYMSSSYVLALARNANQLHIRTAGNPNVSITSVPNTTPIINLRNLKVLSFNLNQGFWTGSNKNNICGAGEEAYYPEIFWSSGCLNGIHVVQNTGSGCLSRWSFSGNNENIEVFLR